MNSNQSASVQQREAWMPIHKSRRRDHGAYADSRAARAESLQTNGKMMVIAGCVITIVGVVAYCAVTFAGGMNAEMGDILLGNVVPLARTTLGVLGLGTLVWLIGSLTYLRGVMDADEEPGEDGTPSV